MDITQNCSDISDIVPFYRPLDLYLKPIATISITLQLPSTKLVGKSISNKLIMQHINDSASPDVFCSLKVIKSTLEFIKFEGELLSKNKVNSVLARLDGKFLKIPGYPTLKLRACSIKPNFPSKHDWDSFFRDAKYMNEMKAGERPDTIYLSHIPSEWFSTPKSRKPSDHLLKKTFSQFGDVNLVDIPGNDPYRAEMKSHISGMKLFTDYQGAIFEAYIQFKDYISFVHAMDRLRGMKLMKKTKEAAVTANIKVDFDRTKHLSENSIRKRVLERDKLMAKEREREDMLRKAEEEEEMRRREELSIQIAQENAKAERRRRREEKRKEKELKKLKKTKEVDDLNQKIASEEHLLLLAQRKLESIRLLTELFNRVKEKYQGNSQPECSKIAFQGTSFNSFGETSYKESSYKNYDMYSKPLSGIKSRLDFKNRIVPPPRESFRNSFRTRGRLHDSYSVRDGYMHPHLPLGYARPDDYMTAHPPVGPDGHVMGPMVPIRHENPYMRPGMRRGNIRGRGRGDWRGRANWRPPIHTFIPAQIYYGATHDLYYRYFERITRDSSRSHSRSRSRSKSRSRARDRSRSRSRSRSRRSSRSSYRSRSRSSSRSKGRSSHRHRSRSKSRRRSRSSSRSRSRSHSKSRRRSRTKSRSDRSWS